MMEVLQEKLPAPVEKKKSSSRREKRLGKTTQAITGPPVPSLTFPLHTASSEGNVKKLSRSPREKNLKAHTTEFELLMTQHSVSMEEVKLKEGRSPRELKKHLKKRNMVYKNVQMVAITDFISGNNGELNFKKGDIINFVEKDDNSWVCGATDDDRVGWFPLSSIACITTANPFELPPDAQVDEKTEKLQKKDKLERFLQHRPSVKDLGSRNVLQEFEHEDVDENIEEESLLVENLTIDSAPVEEVFEETENANTQHHCPIQTKSIPNKRRKLVISRFLKQKQKKEKSSVFGHSLISLVSHLPDEVKVPSIITQSISYLREREAHKHEGIFRISGNKEETTKLREFFSSPTSEVIFTGFSIDCIATLIKQFLMNLSEPVIPFELFDTHVLPFDDLTSDEKMMHHMKDLISKLPLAHRVTLRYLMEYLVVVKDHSQVNFMTSANLGVVFGPNLMRKKVQDHISLMNTASARIVEFMIDNYSVLF